MTIDRESHDAEQTFNAPEIMQAMLRNGCEPILIADPDVSWVTDDLPPKLPSEGNAPLTVLGAVSEIEPMGIDTTLLDDSACSTPPLPLDAFGPWSSWISETRKYAGCPEDYVAASLLSGASAAIGTSRKVAASSDGWFEQLPIIWIALVGAPSSGKSQGMKATMKALQRVEADELATYQQRDGGLQEQEDIAKMHEANWRKKAEDAIKTGSATPPRPPESHGPAREAVPHLLVGDTTPEAMATIVAGNPRGVLQTRDELAALLTSFDRYTTSDAGRAMYLEAYDGKAHRYSRKSGGTVIVPQLAIGICGGLQPDRFKSLLEQKEDDGMQSRFLYVFPHRRPFPGRPQNRPEEVRLEVALRRLRELQFQDGEERHLSKLISLCDAGSDKFEEWCRQFDCMLDKSTGRMAGWLGKSPGRVLRIALVLALMDWSFDGTAPEPHVVTPDVLDRAIRLHDYFYGMAQKTFGDGRLSEQELKARALARWLVEWSSNGSRQASFTARDLYKNRPIAVIRTPVDAAQALNYLEDAGWLTYSKERRGSTSGKASDRYSLTPRASNWLKSRHSDAAKPDGGQKGQ